MPQWWFRKLRGMLKIWLLGEFFEPVLSMFSKNYFTLPQLTCFVIAPILLYGCSLEKYKIWIDWEMFENKNIPKQFICSSNSVWWTFPIFKNINHCYDSDLVKNELRVESLKARVEFQKCEFKSTSYEFKFTSYQFNFTSYEFKSTSYEFNFTSYELSLKISSFPWILSFK